MVVHHWSNDGMVTYHRWSLVWPIHALAPPPPPSFGSAPCLDIGKNAKQVEFLLLQWHLWLYLDWQQPILEPASGSSCYLPAFHNSFLFYLVISTTYSPMNCVSCFFVVWLACVAIALILIIYYGSDSQCPCRPLMVHNDEQSSYRS